MSSPDILAGDLVILVPEFLLTSTHMTLNAMHYGRDPSSPRVFVERKPGDTRLW